MKGASTEAAPAGNRGLTNVTNKESTMAASQHTRTSDGAGNIPPLVASINAHRDGRDPAQVDREIWAALRGASIEDLMRFRAESARRVRMPSMLAPWSAAQISRSTWAGSRPSR